jgi:hypothetical protein
LPKGEPFGPGNCGAANNVNGVHETGGFFAFCSGVIVRLELIEEVSTMRPAFLVILTLAFNAPLIVQADTLLIEGIEKSRTSVTERPSRGMSMDGVAAKWGAPVSKGGAVGQPPITRWEYQDFVVFFEYQHVIHAVPRRS